MKLLVLEFGKDYHFLIGLEKKSSVETVRILLYSILPIEIQLSEEINILKIKGLNEIEIIDSLLTEGGIDLKINNRLHIVDFSND